MNCGKMIVIIMGATLHDNTPVFNLLPRAEAVLQLSHLGLKGQGIRIKEYICRESKASQDEQESLINKPMPHFIPLKNIVPRIRLRPAYAGLHRDKEAQRTQSLSFRAGFNCDIP